MKSKEIGGTKGRYLIYDDGRVYSNASKAFLSLSIRKSCSTGYQKVGLYMPDGKRKHKDVHRLVAEAFIPNPLDKPQVNHINGNGIDNRVENLEWVTARENTQHAVDTGLLVSKKGEESSCSKLSNAEVVAINQEFKDGVPLAELARKYRISQGIASNIARGLKWKHLGLTAEKRRKSFTGSTQQMIEMHEQGMHKSKIAEAIGCSAETVRVYLNSHYKEVQAHHGIKN